MIWNTRLHAAASAILILTISAALAAQVADPWARLPAAPASCFQDDYPDRLNDFGAELDTEFSEQTEMNSQVKQQGADPLAQMQRIQTLMQTNPQEAARLIQSLQNAANSAAPAGADGTVAAVQAGPTGPEGVRMDQEFARQAASFRTAVETAVGPIRARQAALINARTSYVGGGPQIGRPTPEAVAQYAALVRQENAAYEAACAPFFRAGGTFSAWLASYRTNVSDRQIAALEADHRTVMATLTAANAATGTYRSTARLEGLRAYLPKVHEAYDLRLGRKPEAFPMGL